MMIRCGRIPYINLFPVFYYLEREFGDRYSFTDGVPSVLNKLLRAGKLDLSPSSSIEYLRYPDMYNLVPGHSVSSTGPIGSIILFSRLPVRELDGNTILYLYHSETSVALLRIIMERFYNLECRYRSFSGGLYEGLRESPAYLMIGDRAMMESKDTSGLHVYDLGEIWQAETYLPFVYALWIVRGDISVEVVKKDLDRVLDLAEASFESIASLTPASEFFSSDELVRYWRGISYRLDDSHLKGLELFRKYCLELGIIKGN